VKSLDSQVSFTGGETTPKVDARVDIAKYKAMLRQCLNVVPYKTGGFTRSPGTQKIAQCKLVNTAGHNYAVRTEPFIFSPETTFELEFGNNYIRFYSNKQQVNVTYSDLPHWVNVNAYSVGTFVQYMGTAYYCILAVTAAFPLGNGPPNTDATHWSTQTILEVPSPYNADAGSSGPQPGSIYATDVWGLAFEQINDVIYISSPSYPPYSLTRFGDLDWILEPVPFLTPALLDQNATDVAITASAVQGNGITLTVTAPNWVTSTYYTVGNSVTNTGVIYNCLVPHVSGTFGSDLANGFWVATNTFNTEHIGSTWQLAYLNQAAYLEYDGVAATGFVNGTSATTIKCLGAWEVHTYGVWSSDVAIEQSTDLGNTWNTVQMLTSRSDANYDVTGTATVTSLFRIVVTNSAGLVGPIVVAGNFISGSTYTILTIGTTDFTLIGAKSNTVGLSFVATGVGTGTGTATAIATGVTNPRIVFEVVNAFIDGLVLITAVTDAYHATANVVTQLLNTGATVFWSEAAWSAYRGYPSAVTTFQQRVIYGGSGYEPQRIWGTVTDDIENFALGDQTLATDSFAFDLNAPSRGPIQWLIAQLDLFVGFSGAEWVVNSGSTNSTGQTSGAAVTATSINATESSSWGSAENVAPAIVGDVLFFTQRQATSIRQMLFSVYSEKYMTQDLTTLSDHLFTSGIAQLAYQTRWRKQSLVWAVTQCGSLCGMTYELDQEVFGWHRRQTGYGQVDSNGNAIPNDNGFESVSVIPGTGLDDDQVWVVVNRLIGGVQTRFMELINPTNWEEVFTGAPAAPAPVLANAFYVDCGITITNPGTLTLTGLSYLNGRYVVGLADGNAFGPLLVSGGSVTLPASIPTTVATVQVGLPIAYAGQPMRMDTDPRQGNTQGRTKQLDSRFYIRVWNSMGGSISNGTTKYPTWVSGMSYSVGQNVISPATHLAYQCVVANSGTTDPSTSANFVQTNLPVYIPPVPIPYTSDIANPFAVPTLVTTPKDILVPPALNPDPNNDPLIIVQSNDALPLTVLALIYRPDINE